MARGPARRPRCSATRGGRPSTGRREPADRDAADGRGPLGGDRRRRRGSRSGRPVVGSLSTTRAWIAGRPRSLFAGEPGDPLHAQAGRRRRPHRRRAGAPASRGRTSRGPRDGSPIFGGSSASVDERDHRPLGEREPLLERRHRREDVGRARGSAGAAAAGVGRVMRQGRRRPHRARAYRYDSAVAPIDVARASRTSSSSATRSSCTTRSPRSRRTRAAPARSSTIAGNERRHAEVWAAKLRERGRRRARRGRPRRGCGSGSSSCSPACSGRTPSATSCRRSRATRRRRTTRRASPGGRGDRGRRARARRDLAAARSDAGEARRAGRRVRRAIRVRRATAAIASAGTGPAGRGRCGPSSSASATASSATSSLVMGVAGALGRRAPVHPAGRHRRPARRRVQHGRRRVHLDAEPARAVRAPDRPRAGRAGGDARGGGGRAGRRSTGPRASPTRRRTRSPHRIFQDPERALDTLIREELGLDPDELGSPWGAAGGSFVAFAVGARDPGHPVPVRRRRRRLRGQPRAEPRRAVRGRRRREPPDRPRHAVLRRAPGRDRAPRPPS